MINQDDVANADLLLHPFDFPEYFDNMAHPNDGQITSTPITPEFIRNTRHGYFRMLVRISLRLGDDRYVPYTFVCDTGAPMHFYLSTSARVDLAAAGRIRLDENKASIFTVAGRNAVIRDTPHTHQPGNIIGMLMLERLGLQMEEGSFIFAHPLPFL
jgi:hypothetical protein